MSTRSTPTSCWASSVQTHIRRTLPRGAGAAGPEGVLVINLVIHAEVGALCSSIDELDELLAESLFRREPLPWPAGFLAGQALRRYRRNKGGKTRVMTDFLIAAHAAHAACSGYTLVSREQGYGRYFTVELIDPAGGQGPAD